MKNYKAVKNLLSKGNTNAKTAKNIVSTFILYLAPFTQNFAGVNICPNATKECIKACLYSAGRGKFTNVQESRLNKTDYLIADRQQFFTQLAKEIQTKIKTANKRGEKVAFRLNGTSDIDHVKQLGIFAKFDALNSGAIFYDYTKSLKRVQKYVGTNYHLTFSYSGRNKVESAKALAMGANVAVVFEGPELPKTFGAFEVVDGDKTDFRPDDKKGVIVGLIAKGEAKKEKGIFVVTNEQVEQANKLNLKAFDYAN